MLYRDSKGDEHVIQTMNPMKLLNAYRAMVRDGWNPDKFDSQAEHDDALAEMKEQVGRNRTTYKAELRVERETADAERVVKIDEILAKMEAEEAAES